MELNLAPLTQADGPQLRLERWTNLLASAELSQIVDFIRDTEEIRSSVETVNAMNTIFTKMAEIVKDVNLTEGTIKTLPDAKKALTQLIAARRVETAKWLMFTNTTVDQKLLAEKVAAGSGASATFGHAAGAQTGAGRSVADLQS